MTASTGINRETGKPLTDLAHVRQSVVTIFTTRIGDRIMRRTFGSKVPGLLGRNLVPSTLMRFWAALILGCELWEPRLRIEQVLYPAPPNAPSTLRVGDITVAVLAIYRPFALQGDVRTDAKLIYL